MTVALELGLVDAERGLVLNTSNGQQLSLTVILETGLLATPKLSLDLIEALELGLYSDETGLFVDPFTKQPQIIPFADAPFQLGLHGRSSTSAIFDILLDSPQLWLVGL